MTVVRSSRARAVIDLGAIEHNISTLRRLAGVPVMAVVKADGYGHGAVPVALAAKNAGAEWLGVCFVDEALELRQAGVPGPILAWLLAADDNLGEAIDQDIDLSISTREQLVRIAALAQARGIRARVHIELDTGLARAGVSRERWQQIFELAASMTNDIEVISIWSHLACADEPRHPANAHQQDAYEAALQMAAAAGLDSVIRHLSNSAGTLAHPDLRYDLVRCGIATYGIAPGGDLEDPSAFGLKPAMTVSADIAYVRHLNPGDGVSYSHRWHATKPTNVGLIPLGYADGIPRAATNAGWVTYNGADFPIVGTVCMDQFVVDFGDTFVRTGETVTIFGGEGAAAHQWAAAARTIGYELVTRLGERVERTYTDGV